MFRCHIRKVPHKVCVCVCVQQSVAEGRFTTVTPHYEHAFQNVHKPRLSLIRFHYENCVLCLDVSTFIAKFAFIALITCAVLKYFDELSLIP